MIRIEDYPYPCGLDLLARWQAGAPDSKREMTGIFDAAIAGEFDANFTVLATTRRKFIQRPLSICWR